MNYKARRASSLILGLFSALGTVVTAILVAKETPKAMEKIKEIKEKNKDIKKIDYVKALIPIYWPAGLMCLGTMASTTVSQIISVKTEASLIATSTMLSQGWNRYKGKIKDVLGVKGNELITNCIASNDYEKNQPKPNKTEMLLEEKKYAKRAFGEQTGIHFVECRLCDWNWKCVEISVYYGTLWRRGICPDLFLMSDHYRSSGSYDGICGRTCESEKPGKTVSKIRAGGK